MPSLDIPLKTNYAYLKMITSLPCNVSFSLCLINGCEKSKIEFLFFFLSFYNCRLFCPVITSCVNKNVERVLCELTKKLCYFEQYC